MPVFDHNGGARWGCPSSFGSRASRAVPGTVPFVDDRARGRATRLCRMPAAERVLDPFARFEKSPSINRDPIASSHNARPARGRSTTVVCPPEPSCLQVSPAAPCHRPAALIPAAVFIVKKAQVVAPASAREALLAPARPASAITGQHSAHQGAQRPERRFSPSLARTRITFSPYSEASVQSPGRRAVCGRPARPSAPRLPRHCTLCRPRAPARRPGHRAIQRVLLA